MSEQRSAVWPTGECCEGLVVVDDPWRAGCVWYRHAPPGPRWQPAIHATLPKTITRPDGYLAVALPEWVDENLAAELECAATSVWRLRRTGGRVWTAWTRRALWSQP